MNFRVKQYLCHYEEQQIMNFAKSNENISQRVYYCFLRISVMYIQRNFLNLSYDKYVYVCEEVQICVY